MQSLRQRLIILIMAHPVDLQLPQALQLANSGRLEDAYAIMFKAINHAPNNHDVNNLMGYVLARKAEFKRALPFMQKACKLHPLSVVYQTNLGKLLTDLSRPDDAIRVLEGAVSQRPDDLVARINIVEAMLQKNMAARAVEHARVAMTLAPADPRSSRSLGAALLALGRAEEALSVFEAASAKHPRDLDLASMRAFASNYATSQTPQHRFDAHLAYARALDTALPPVAAYQGPSGTTSQDAERTLKIGVISPDLRSHAVASFIEPVLENLDRQNFLLFAYSTAINEDKVSERLKKNFKTWRNASTFDHASLPKVILADRIDILIELAGHTANHRLPVHNVRPAPVHVTYLGYPNTTGLSTMDWRVVDGITDPTSSADRGPGADAFATERLWRLDPCFLCYKPPAAAVSVTPSAPAAGTAVTFGSFNALQKINAATIELWAKLLHRVPEARLLIKTPVLADEGARTDLSSRLAAAGIELSRVELIGWTASPEEHFAAYGRVHVALDSFPYHGTTTTCDTLLMGVPMVTLAGDAHVSRVGCSILRAVGLPELIAESPEQYVEIASALARDAARINTIRAELRQRLMNSPLCDAAGFGKRFGDALRAMWRIRCGVTG